MHSYIRHAVSFVIAALLLVAGVPAHAQSPTRSVSCDVAVSSFAANSNEPRVTVNGRWFRDQNHRTRVELGARVVVNDPTAGTTTEMNTVTQLFNLMNWGPPGNYVSDLTTLPPGAKSLGSKTVEGLACSGWQLDRTIPANSPLGNKDQATTSVAVWFARDVRCLVEIEAFDTLGNSASLRRSNFVFDEVFAEEMFHVPVGYRSATLSDIYETSNLCHPTGAPAVLELRNSNNHEGTLVVALNDFCQPFLPGLGGINYMSGLDVDVPVDEPYHKEIHAKYAPPSIGPGGLLSTFGPNGAWLYVVKRKENSNKNVAYLIFVVVY